MKTASEFFVRKQKPKAGTCFVLMPFQEALTAVYEHGIKPLVESVGMQCKRADELYSAQGILGDIWDSIQAAEIIIADLTGKNPNVMYELGLCHALWKRVILLSQNRDDVPFDLRAWRVLWYDFTFAGAARLKEELQRAIVALRADKVSECELVPLNGCSETRPTSGAWLHGIVAAWKPNDRYGFIRVGDEDFYFNSDYLFSTGMEPREGQHAVFLPLEPLKSAKNRRASRVFVLGSNLSGRLNRVIAGKGYGFAEVIGQRGESHNLFLLLSDERSLAPGAAIECTVSENEQGPIGVDVRIPEVEAAA